MRGDRTVSAQTAQPRMCFSWPEMTLRHQKQMASAARVCAYQNAGPNGRSQGRPGRGSGQSQRWTKQPAKSDQWSYSHWARELDGSIRCAGALLAGQTTGASSVTGSATCCVVTQDPSAIP